MRISRGFTLVELMVVVAVFGLTLTVAIPSFSEWISNSRVWNAANELQTSLVYARTEASRRGRMVEVIITNASTDTLDPVGAEAGTNIVVQLMDRVDPNEAIEILRGKQMSPASEASLLVNADGSVMAFNPFGRLAGGGQMRFIFTTPAATRAAQVSVAVSGIPRVCVFPAKFINDDGSLQQGAGC